MTGLGELQAEIAAERASRGFTTDPERLLVLLVEEVGEVARELKKTWSPNYDHFEVEHLGSELADVLVLVCALASAHGVDLGHSVRHKFFGVDAERTWKSAPK